PRRAGREDPRASDRRGRRERRRVRRPALDEHSLRPGVLPGAARPDSRPAGSPPLRRRPTGLKAAPVAMALRGHLWTLMPRLQRSLRSPRVRLGEAWSCVVVDPVLGDVRLTGVLHVPEGAREAVVLVHGLGGSADSDYLRIAAAAAARTGMASLRLSLRGADGLGEDYYHAGLIDDLTAALRCSDLARFERL